MSNFQTCSGIMLTALVLSLLACQPSAECLALVQAQTELTTQLKKHHQTWEKIFNESQIDLINAELFADTVTFSGTPAPSVGIAALKAYYQNYLTGFSNIDFSVNSAIGQSDKIANHWTFRGKHSGEFFGAPASGYDIMISGLTLAKLKGGKIVAIEVFYDNLSLRRQLGLIPLD
ncbi:MAG: ester cyclase [Lewinella sp.]|nr:ester cyclase [Lewinella sp.]